MFRFTSQFASTLTKSQPVQGFKRGFSKQSGWSETTSKFSRFSAIAGVGLLVATGGYLYTESVSAEEEKKEKVSLNNEFKKFTLGEIIPVNHNTKIFRFKLDSPEHTLGLPVAGCVVTKGPIGADGKPIIRPYTPLTGPEHKGTFDLLIKHYPNGAMTTHIHNMKPGDQLEVKGPISKLPYKANMKKEIGMIAGGTGLTPMLQIINEVLKNPNDKTKVTFLFANIANEDILLKDYLDNLAKSHSNFKVYYVLEKPPAGWKQGTGFVSEQHIKENLPKPSADSLILVCGPPGMMKHISGEKTPDYKQGELKGLLKSLGYSEDNVFKF